MIPTLDHLAAREFFDPEVREWSIVELAEPFPEARVAAARHTAASLGDLLGRLTREDDLEVAWFLPEDHVPGRPEATIGPPGILGWRKSPRSSTTELATW